MAIVNKAHPFANRQSVTMAELADQPMIAYAPGLPGRIMLDTLFSKIDRTPTIIYEGNVPHAMAPALERNLGVFLQADHTARFNMPLYDNCAVIPVEDASYQANTSRHWSPSRPRSEAAKRFAEFCKEFCAEEA